MRLLNREESLLLDKLASTQFDISIEKLIHNAASGMLLKLESLFEFAKDKIRTPLGTAEGMIFLIGPGNNGEDGLCLSRLIANKYPFLPIKIYRYHEFSKLPDFLEKQWVLPMLVIDAIFGVGLNRNLNYETIKIIERLNSKKKIFQIISLDISSGLDANTGNEFGTAVKADYTFACEYPKVGSFLNYGPSRTGKIIKISIGFPKELIIKVAVNFRLIQKKEAKLLMPQKSPLGNKSKYGHLLVVAGSEKMPGALRLASEAASRSGVGYVTLALEEDLLKNLKNVKELLPDFLFISKQELLKLSAEELKKKFSGFLFGPGLEHSFLNQELLEKLLKLKMKILIDAEGLNFVAKYGIELHENCIVTPHAGELSRLIGRSAREIENERISACKEFAKKFAKATLLLKGPKTLIYDQKKFYIISSGNKALSKAGTGDVLSGIIGSYLAQGLSLEKATCLGAYIHGSLADRWIQDGNNFQSLLASDLVERLKKFKF